MNKPAPALSLHGIVWVPSQWDSGATVLDGGATTWEPIKKVAQLTKLSAANAGRVGNKGQQIRAHVIPFDPQTPAQIARRTAFQTAMANWSALSPAQKQAYNAQAQPLKISGVNLFIREQTT